MTTYEFFRWLTFPIMPTLLATVRKDLLRLCNTPARLSILDVGGRKSPYTVGLKADITLLDVPRESSVQQQLNLGLSDEILTGIQKIRSNIKAVVVEDMTKTTLPDESFDAVVSIEVIEHVEQDELFAQNIARVIRPGGWAYFTTPNGDYVKNEPPYYNPDHKRHYTKSGLEDLLKKYFKRVEVRYAVKTGRYRWWGLKGYTVSRPFTTLKSILGNVINRIESKGLDKQAVRTAHLIARVYK